MGVHAMLLNLLLSACNAFTVHIAAGQGFQQTVSDLRSEYVVKRFPIKSSKTVTVKFTKLSSEPADPGLCFVKTHEVKSILFDMGETVPSLENEIKKNRERERDNQAYWSQNEMILTVISFCSLHTCNT